MRKIIVGVDQSSEARDALHLARAFARATDAELIVAAAFDPSASADPRGAESEYFVDVFDRAQSELGELKFARRELTHVSAPRGLTDVAHEEGAGLIVIGSTHRGKLGRVLPGSVGERLLSGAPCAIAVAPRDYARTPHFGLGLIGVAYAGDDESHHALEQAAWLGQHLDAELRLITIVPVPGGGEGQGASATVLRDHGHEVQQTALDQVDASVEIETVLEDGDPAPALARHGVELDLLVMGSRGYGPVRRTLLGGVSADVMRTAPCPVMIVPRTAAFRSSYHDLSASRAGAREGMGV